MILYTPIYLEDIYNNTNNLEIKEVYFNGILVQVMQKSNNNFYEVVRIISSNPFDFINSEIQPGKIIEI